jgi:carbamate kinase
VVLRKAAAATARAAARGELIPHVAAADEFLQQAWRRRAAVGHTEEAAEARLRGEE